jgi:hypothetical protein
MTAAFLLAAVNVFAAMPWDGASAAVAKVLPSHVRGQGTALYLLVVNLFAGVVGPTGVPCSPTTCSLTRRPCGTRCRCVRCWA